MKKQFLIGLLLIFSIGLVGCGEVDPNDIINGGNNENPGENGGSENKEDIVNLYSDDKKLVFNYMNIYYITYYHEGDTITGLEYVYQYEDAATAKIAKTMLDSTYAEEDNIKSVVVKGKYIIIAFTEDEYKDETLEEVKQTYSYLEQIYKNN